MLDLTGQPDLDRLAKTLLYAWVLGLPVSVPGRERHVPPVAMASAMGARTGS